jgi:hypothetical protein
VSDSWGLRAFNHHRGSRALQKTEHEPELQFLREAAGQIATPARSQQFWQGFERLPQHKTRDAKQMFDRLGV